MRALGPSFLSLQILPQDSIRRTRQALSEAQQELSTQRHFDVSLKLGYQVGRNIGWHAELSAVEANIAAVGVASIHAEAAATSLEALRKLASSFLDNLVSSRAAPGGQAIIREQAQSAFAMLRDLLNINVGGIHPFAGRNQNAAPLRAYEAGAGQAQVTASFFADFGFPPGDPAMQTLTGNQVTTFLNSSFAALFSSPNWENTFSDAGLDSVSLRVGRADALEILPNANAQAVREFYASLVAISELSTGTLSNDTFLALIDKVAEKTSSAVQGLTDMQSRLGTAKASLADVTEQLKVRKTSLTYALQRSEQVDSYEAATRINSLMAQLEASYSITGRISRLSLLNYL